jgi:integrase
MRGLHLKQVGLVWHYQRRRPNRFADIEPRPLIRLSLHTTDYSKARLLAAQISSDLERDWDDAFQRGTSLAAQDSAERFRAAAELQRSLGLEPRTSSDLTDAELLERLRRLIDGSHIQPEQKAVLGLIEQPKLSLADAFDRFWNYIQDEWMRVSHDQQRVKRNVYLKAMRNFETAVGVVPFHKVERRHAVEFRSWWVERLKAKGLKPYTGNREINSLRRLFTVNFDIDGQSMPNPFSGVRLKETAEVARIPLSTEQIQALLQPEALASLHEDFQRLFRLLINTGMRPVEAIGLELADVNLDHEVPHVHVRKNSVRGLKTDHSERLLPLLGVSLCAAQELVDGGGWGKRLGKNMYATSIINRRFREGGLVTDPRQSLYSLRHWFQDQLTKRDVVDRAQAQLMGHKFQRPKYGYGKDLDELRDIVAEFAIGA